MLRKEKYKDLDKWRDTKKRQKRRYYSKTKDARNRYRKWAPEEIEMVVEHKIPDAELSSIIGRSIAAIQNQRCMYNKQFIEKQKNS